MWSVVAHMGLTLRRIGQHWFDLNSMQAKPAYIGSTYVAMLLQTLQRMGKSVFVVLGAYPLVELAMDDAKLARAVAAHKPAGAAGAGGDGHAVGVRAAADCRRAWPP